MKDLKYLAAYSIPLCAVIGLVFKGLWAYATPLYAFILIPLLELAFPRDHRNRTPEDAQKAQVNPIFDLMLYVNVPLVYAILIAGIALLCTEPLPAWEQTGILLSLGIVLGVNGINVGHELGHRKSRWERILGKILLIPNLYTHFFVEHNFGHHLHAATPEDPATARYNQPLYCFWFSSITRQYRNAWHIQRQCLIRENCGFWTLRNDMLWGHLAQLAYLIVIYAWQGPWGMIYAMIAALGGVLLLETVNYVEHYCLLRKRLPSGRYERVREIHSWNSDHVVGRIVLYELTRHSDHHFKSTIKYPLLRSHETAPQMPFGYPTSMVIAAIPPLWFYIMNPRIPAAMKPAL